MIILFITSYIAGIISILSPCVLPMVPVIFAGSQGSWRRGVAVVAGMIVFFTLMGFMVSFAGSLTLVRFLAYLGIFIFGLILISDHLYERYSALTSRFIGKLKVPADSFLFGAFLGLVWTPCIGPVVGALLGYNALNSGTVEGVLSMLFFGGGIATGIGLILKAGERRKVFMEYGEKLRKASGYVILIFLILLVSGLLGQIEVFLSRLIPL